MTLVKPIHVGIYIREAYMEPLGLSNKQLSSALDINPSTLTRLLSGKASCSTEMALRLAKVFSTSVECWLNLQRNYDLANVDIPLDNVKVLLDKQDQI